MADCVAAQVARERAVQRGTHEKQDRAWRQWKEYLGSIRIKNNDFLNNFSREQRHSLIGAFALAVREARFLRSTHDPLVASTVNGTIQCLCSTFRETFTQTQLLTKTASLHSFYSKSLGHSKISTHRTNTKQQSLYQSSPSSTNETPRNSNKQLPNSPHSESSSQCNRVNTSKFINQNSKKPTSSGFETSDSSETANNSTTATLN
jgi:hypothetical protein